MTTTTTEQAERVSFEAAARLQPAFNPAELNRRDMAGSERLGEYVIYATEHAWRLWQVRATIASTVPAASPASES